MAIKQNICSANSAHNSVEMKTKWVAVTKFMHKQGHGNCVLTATKWSTVFCSGGVSLFQNTLGQQVSDLGAFWVLEYLIDSIKWASTVWKAEIWNALDSETFQRSRSFWIW